MNENIRLLQVDVDKSNEKMDEITRQLLESKKLYLERTRRIRKNKNSLWDLTSYWIQKPGLEIL